MNVAVVLGMTPRESIEQECARRGKDAVVAGCIELLAGGEADAELILALGGPPARWADVALQSLKAVLNDDAWRVREMALKVVARHSLEDTLMAVAELQEDPSAGVRAAASRALMRISAGSS